jgi:pimeloyl-ACP methyl ester carboxylesterase
VQVLVEVLDQSGHMPHMEVPRTVNALIQDLVVHHEL